MYRCDPCKTICEGSIRRHQVLREVQVGFGQRLRTEIAEEVPVCPKCQAELLRMRQQGVPSGDAISALRRRHRATKSIKTDSGVTVTTTVGGLRVLDRFPGE